MSASYANAVPTQRSGLLRPALVADAVVSAANGVAYLAAAGPIGDALGLSSGLLRGVGAFFLVWAVCVALVARTPRRGAVTAVIVLNAVWVVDSLVVAAAGWGDPTTAGTVWIVLQALAVAGLAAAQAVGRRELEGAV